MMTMNRAMEISAFLTLPSAVALAVMPEFLIGGLFERGQFTNADTVQAAKALRMFAFGLPAFVLLKVLTPAFFARENTKTPMIYAAISAVINVSLGYYLFVTIGFYGLALATSVAAWTNAICLIFILRRNKYFVRDDRLTRRFPRIALASLIMGGALWYIAPHAKAMLEGLILIDYSLLLFVCGIGFGIYAVAAFVLRAFNVHDIKDAFRRMPAEDST
jgi:putative peptidoglycan lipid II flippase